MRSRKHNCYNCKYMGYDYECMAWQGEWTYDYCLGGYIYKGAADTKYIDDIIGTKYCKFTLAIRIDNREEKMDRVLPTTRK